MSAQRLEAILDAQMSSTRIPEIGEVFRSVASGLRYVRIETAQPYFVLGRFKGSCIEPGIPGVGYFWPGMLRGWEVYRDETAMDNAARGRARPGRGDHTQG